MVNEECTAFVTGSNRGIGRAFVEALRKAGVRRIYAAARDTASVEDLLAGDQGRIVPVTLDINNDQQIRTAIGQAGDVNLLVNNAGIARGASFIAASSLDAARAEMETNYFGTLAVTRAFAPVLANNGGGAIVNVASIAAWVNFPALGSYSASKAAVHSMTQGVRADLAGQGTAVVGVYPGPVETDMAEGLEMDKAPPSQIAEAALEAVRNGTEDVFPDAMSAQIRAGLKKATKATEKHVASMAPSAH